MIGGYNWITSSGHRRIQAQARARHSHHEWGRKAPIRPSMPCVWLVTSMAYLSFFDNSLFSPIFLPEVLLFAPAFQGSGAEGAFCHVACIIW